MLASLRAPTTVMRAAARVGARSSSSAPTGPWAPNKSNVDAAHWDDKWDMDRLTEDSQDHLMATWGPGAGLRGLPFVTHGEGVHVFDSDGKKYLDWTSQAVCVNLGYDVPEGVVKAVNKQLTELPMAYGGLGNTEVRVRLGQLLSELLPGDLNGFLFPNGGSEANEAAMRIARRFTGRTKIINQYRSYHGGSPGALQATGDFRRNFTEDASGAAPGFIKTPNPTNNHRFSFGDTDAEITPRALAFLEDQIMCEGKDQIAAIMLEPIVGAGGCLVAPEGYMQGVRALCDKYGILLIADEVMIGFGRTGTFWGFQNYEGFLPDIVTSAKGLTGAYLPLSMVAVRDEIKEHFETSPLGWGATYHAHPVAMAAAYEAIKYLLEKDLVANAKNVLEPVIEKGLKGLQAKYDCIGDVRYVGAFGCLDIIGPDGEPFQELNGTDCVNGEALLALRGAFRENGLYNLFRPPLMHVAPALVMTPAELEDGFEKVDRSFATFQAILDANNNKA